MVPPRAGTAAVAEQPVSFWLDFNQGKHANIGLRGILILQFDLAR
jgi:hypothetical protein